MAERLVFVPAPRGPLVEERKVQFQWFPGFAESQKQKSIEALHRAADEASRPLSPTLEVSTKSRQSLGRKLSAFNLCVVLDGRRILLEAAFQGAKVFDNGKGPFTDLFSLDSGREVKRRMRPYADSPLKEFRWNGETWPLRPTSAFYDWLYLQALSELIRSEPDVDKGLREYEAFTDIEFNHRKSLNCQARSCALYVALCRSDDLSLGQLMADPATFRETLGKRGYGAPGHEARPRTSLF